MRILKYGEKVLRKPAEPVDLAAWREKLPDLIERMWAALDAAQGVGLAAPQVGVSLRLAIVCARSDEKSRRFVLVNPEIVAHEGTVVEEEGCLSLPGVYAKVPRFARVRLRACDEKGRVYEVGAGGLLARAFQHEIDHLDGRLFIDYLSFADRLKVMSLIKDLRKDWE